MLFTLAKHDFVLAKEMKIQVDRTVIHKDVFFKFSDGQILQTTNWGVIFKATKNKNPVNVIMSIDDRVKFTNDFIAGILKRMALCEQNNDKEI